MTRQNPYQRKIGFLVTEELYNRFCRQFEWGERSKIFVRVIEWLTEKVEKHGKEALVVLLREENFDKLVKMLKEDASCRGEKDGDYK